MKRLILFGSCLSSFLISCCGVEPGKGRLTPLESFTLPLGESKEIFYDGLKTLYVTEDFIISHTTIYDGGFQNEDNRLCYTDIATKSSKILFPQNDNARRYCQFDGYGYLSDNRLFFQYEESQKRYTCSISIPDGKVLANIPSSTDERTIYCKDVVGKDGYCYVIFNGNSILRLDIDNFQTKQVLYCPHEDINSLKFTSDGKLLVFTRKVIDSKSFESEHYAYIIDIDNDFDIHKYYVTPDMENYRKQTYGAKAFGLENNGILYSVINTYTCAIELSTRKLTWERIDYWSHSVNDIYISKKLLIKCSGDALSAINTNNGELAYSFIGYNAHYSIHDEEIAYMVNSSSQLDIINTSNGEKLDWISCPTGAFFGSYPTIYKDNIYIMGGNQIFCYPKYPWN